MEKYKLDMENGCGLPQWVVITGLVSELLLAVNSSINFFIYCFMSSLFRDVLCSTLKGVSEHLCGTSVHCLFLTEGQRRRRRHRRRSQQPASNEGVKGQSVSTFPETLTPSLNKPENGGKCRSNSPGPKVNGDSVTNREEDLPLKTKDLTTQVKEENGTSDTCLGANSYHQGGIPL